MKNGNIIIPKAEQLWDFIDNSGGFRRGNPWYDGYKVEIKNDSMKIVLPDIKMLVKIFLPTVAYFFGDFIHPVLGKTRHKVLSSGG